MATKQRGFWFKAYTTILPNSRSPVWQIDVEDSPDNPGWAAWCTLMDLGDVELSASDLVMMERGQTLRYSGLII